MVQKFNLPSIAENWGRLQSSFFILLSIVFLPWSLRGQWKEPVFEHLTIDDGLSQNLVYSIIQDYRGFLWFGTNDGLNRYDGYEFRVYSQIPGDTNSLNDNSVTVLFEDSRRHLWVGAGGLNRYDRRGDRFQRVLTADDFPGNLAIPHVNVIAEDPNGDLWLSVRNAGLFRLELPEADDPADALDGFRLVGPYLPKLDQNPSEEIILYSIVFVDNGLLTIFKDQVFHLPAGPDGRFPEPGQSQFDLLPFEVGGEDFRVRSLFVAADQSIWIGTSDGLVHLFDAGRPEAFTHYPYPGGFFDVYWEGIVKKILPDPEGKLWLGTFGGVAIFDPPTKTYRLVEHDPDNPASLSIGNIADMYMDDGQVIWLGTVGMGINKFNAIPKPFSHYLGRAREKIIYSIYDLHEDAQGKIWATTNDFRLISLDRKSGKLIDHQHLELWPINNMVRDKNNIIWMTVNRLLVRYDPESDHMDHYEIFPPLREVPSDSISLLHFDRAGQLWVCNTGNLRHFDPQSGSFETYALPDLYLEGVEALYRDAEGHFWIGTQQGLLRYRVNNGEWELFQAVPGNADSLQHNRVKCVLPDPLAPDQYLWIGTGGGGLFRLDTRQRVFKRYSRADGLPNEFIYGILPDEQGRLWMSTNHGLSCFDPRSGGFTNFTVDDGLQSNEFNSRAYYRSQSGELFFGGVNGITVFRPEAIVPNPHVPPVVLTDMELSYQSVRPGDRDSPLKWSITEAESVFLAHDQNDIAFKFSALDFTLPGSNQYRYQLEGYDDDWIDAGTEHRATYTNLPPGDYRFRVQGANNDGIWNEEGITLQVVINPPFWKTWWAYLAYLLLLGGGLYWAFRQVNLRVRIREELRIKELEARKLAELDQFKSHFFANISHEFRTPITLIQARIEELLAELNRNDLKEKLYSMRRNSQQLMRLIEQLLDIARLEASKMGLKKSAGDLVEFVRMLANSLKSSAQDNGLQLSFSAEPAQCFVAFDRDALQKILQNLISNAIKFTRPGGKVEVMLKAIEQSPGEVAATIEVADTGVGIAAEDIPHVFDRFFQASNNTVVSDRGFGLGLALVKELVALHQGTIGVEAREGQQGTVFRVVLPLPSVKASKEGQPAGPIVLDRRLLELESADLHAPFLDVPGEAAAFRHLSIASGKTILIVEDHDELRHYIAGIFHSGFRIIQASNGRRGLELTVEKMPDLVIADVMMPGMDGFEMCRLLKSDLRTSHIPVILLTAKAESVDRMRGFELGADDYLFKPFNEEELALRVSNLLRSREALKKKYAQSLLAGVTTDAASPTQEEQFLQQVRRVIEKYMGDENFGVELLSKEVQMSSSQLYRKLRALVELSPVQLIQRIRLERAAALLKQGLNVSEVAYQVGLRSPAYFSQLFKKYFGCSPRDYGEAGDI